MIVKITCSCNANFEIKHGSIHPKTIACPNCGTILPYGASEDLLTALDSLEQLESKLEDAGYKCSVSE